MRKLVSALWLGLALLLPLQVFATDYYVATTGSDTTGNGSQTSPWATIDKAGTAVQPGDVVHVAPGTYFGKVTVSASGTSGAFITYVSDTKWGAVINCNTVSPCQDSSAFHNDGSYVKIIGFEVTGIGRDGIYSQGSHVVIQNNHVHDIAGPTSANCDNGGAGIMWDDYSATDQQALANYVHDIGWVNDSQCSGFHTVHGIYPVNNSPVVINNLVVHTRNYGVQLYHCANHALVINNTVVTAGESGILNGNDPSCGTNNVGSILSNNVLTNNGNYGFRDDSGNVSGGVYSNNLEFGNSDGNYVASSGTVTNNVSADPKYVNGTGTHNGDYHLQSGSPAIDAGTSSNGPSTDLDGHARPIGAGYDIGSYEYNSTTAAPAAPTGLTATVN